MIDGDGPAQPAETSDTSSARRLEDGGPESRGPLQEISHEMVQIYKSQFGRGPTKVRTAYAGSDVLVCLLEHTFTPAERNLQSMGEHQRLRDMRLFFQYAERARFVEPVERITNRKVRAFISGIDTQTDIATEMFVLDGKDSADTL